MPPTTPWRPLPRASAPAGGSWRTAVTAPRPPRWSTARGTRTRSCATPPGSSASGGRTHEIQRLIGRALRAVVDLGAMPDIAITLDCDVLQADGGTRTASITGAWVALALALDGLVDGKRLPRRPALDPLAAVSVGIVAGTPVLDLDYVEDSTAGVDMNVVVAGDGRFVEVQGTAEGAPFSRAEMDVLLDLAVSGCGRLFALQQAALAAAR